MSSSGYLRTKEKVGSREQIVSFQRALLPLFSIREGVVTQPLAMLLNPPSPETTTILVIDDDVHVGVALTHLLNGDGYRLIMAPDGSTGLDLAFAERPDLILLDVMMPELDGFQVCRLLRSAERLMDVPVLMLTAMDDREARLEGIVAGADDFITKPFDRTQLRARIRTVTRLGRYRRVLEQEARFEQLFQIAQDGIALVAGNGGIAQVNPAFERMISAARSQTGLHPNLLQYIAPASQSHCRGCMAKLFELGDPITGMETTLTRHDGSEFPAIVSAVQFKWRNESMAQIVIRDISTQRRYELELEQKARIDTNTGLLNRLALRDRLEHTISSGASGCVSLVVVELNRFRTIQEALAGEHCDEIVRQVAERARRCAPPESTVTLLRENQLALIILEATNHARETTRFATELQASLQSPISVDAHEISASVSIGAALWPRDAKTVPELERKAVDAAVLASSGNGFAVQFSSESLHNEASARLALEAQLRRAITRGELELHYQPKVQSHDGRLHGAEALVRWRRPDGGLVSPASFIPLAEESGIIVSMGAWIVDEACRQIAQWRSEGLPTTSISVNVSARQFNEESFPQTCVDAVERHGLSASDIILEITESIAVGDQSRVISRLAELHELGFEIAIDDFGTGYSSLAYLSQLPVRELKLDRSFVNRIGLSSRDDALARSIVAMGTALGYEVVAEGVETYAQAQFLLAANCPVLQGFLYSRPLPARDFADRWLRTCTLGEAVHV